MTSWKLLNHDAHNFPIVKEFLKRRHVQGNAERTRWYSNSKGRTILPNDWLGSMWTRGHLASAGAHKKTSHSIESTFDMANQLPQHYCCNAGEWYRLECISRELTHYYRNVKVVNTAMLLPAGIRSYGLDWHERYGNSQSLSSDAWRNGEAWSKGDFDADISPKEMFYKYENKFLENLEDPESFTTKRGVNHIRSLQLKDGTIVPTHFSKTIYATGRRIFRGGKNLNSDGNLVPINGLPRGIAQSFLVPNCAVPLLLPSYAYTIPHEVIRSEIPRTKSDLSLLRVYLSSVLERSYKNLKEGFTSPWHIYIKKQTELWENDRKRRREAQYKSLIKIKSPYLRCRSLYNWYKDGISLKVLGLISNTPNITDSFLIQNTDWRSDRFLGSHYQAVLQNIERRGGWSMLREVIDWLQQCAERPPGQPLLDNPSNLLLTKASISLSDVPFFYIKKYDREIKNKDEQDCNIKVLSGYLEGFRFLGIRVFDILGWS